MIKPFAGDGCVVRVGLAETASEQLLVEGCRVTGLRVCQDEVDVTTSAGEGWRALLPGAGVRAVQVELAGIYLGSDGEQLLRRAALSGELIQGTVSVDDDRAVSAPFLVSQLSVNSHVNEEATYEVVLQSAGAVTLS